MESSALISSHVERHIDVVAVTVLLPIQSNRTLGFALLDSSLLVYCIVLSQGNCIIRVPCSNSKCYVLQCNDSTPSLSQSNISAYPLWPKERYFHLRAFPSQHSDTYS